LFLLLLVGNSKGSRESISIGCKWLLGRCRRDGRFKKAKYAVEGGEKGSLRQSCSNAILLLEGVVAARVFLRRESDSLDPEWLGAPIVLRLFSAEAATVAMTAAAAAATATLSWCW
jgi:hypothetical protein